MMGITRSRVLMGTLVTVEIGDTTPSEAAHSAAEAALDRMSHIARVMSAHDPDSDLGRISRAHPLEVLTLDAHTVRVLQAAQHWHRLSGGAFDPARAGEHLSRRGVRPGLAHTPLNQRGMREIKVLSATTIQVAQAVALDLGGIAKGYAVDQAMQVLRDCGVAQARVNAGGDLALMGHSPQRIVLCHAAAGPRQWRLGAVRLCQGAMATSTADPAFSEFVPRPRSGRVTGHGVTVQAPDCMTADALTKWALQSMGLAHGLRRALRQHRARVWGSA